MATSKIVTGIHRTRTGINTRGIKKTNMYKILACFVLLTVLQIATAQNAEAKLLCIDKCTSGPTSQFVSCIKGCSEAAVLSDVKMSLARLLSDSYTRTRQQNDLQAKLSDTYEEPKHKETRKERRQRRYNLWMDFLKLNHKFPFP